MKLFMTLTVTGILIWLELFAGNLGLPLGLPLYAALYFAAANGMVYGMVSAGSAGLLLDLLYAREYLAGALTGTAVVALCAAYACRSSRKMPYAPLTCGMLCGLLICLVNWLWIFFSGGVYYGPNPLCMLIFQIVGGGIFMLLFTLTADAVNFRSDLPRFCLRDNRSGGVGDGR